MYWAVSPSLTGHLNIFPNFKFSKIMNFKEVFAWIYRFARV